MSFHPKAHALSREQIKDEIDRLRDGVYAYGLYPENVSLNEQNKLLDALDAVTRVLEDLQAEPSACDCGQCMECRDRAIHS